MVLFNPNQFSVNFQFNVVATDRAIGGRTVRIQVQVLLVRDQSDPSFTQVDYTVTIPETQPVNATILTGIRATDPDPQVNSQIVYYICLYSKP